ncbi:MAG: hypothetical protein L6R41_000425 [Letrouitia leprolyta]|nr:MAG: hypothetical protein L6R41_000425 [Letrouitia leprolyta]
MAPLQHLKAKRRWTFTRNRGAAEESSVEDYGQEILPTVDPDALATLPPADQEKFKEMRKKDRKNVLARWRKEGTPVPESIDPNTNERNEPVIQRSSSAPQLPELRTDVTRDTLSTAMESGGQARAINEGDSRERSLGEGWSELRASQHAHHGFFSSSVAHHNQTGTQPTAESEDLATYHSQIPVVSTLHHEHAETRVDMTAPDSAFEPEQSDETNLWLRVMDNDRYARGRRRFRVPLGHPTNTTASEGPSSSRHAQQPATNASRMESTSGDLALNDRYPGSVMTQGESGASAVMTFGHSRDTPSTSSEHADEALLGETVEQRRMRELGVQDTYLQRIDNDRERDYARFRGLGPVPPGLALFANAPSGSERAHARTARTMSSAVASGEEAAIHTDALTAARRAAVAGPSTGTGVNFGEAHGDLFVRPRPSSGLEISPVQPSASSQGQPAGQPQEGMGSVKTNPIKRIVQKIGTKIKNAFRSRGERAGVPAASRRASQFRAHDEARVGTATAVTLTPVRAPQPVQARHLCRAPPPLQPASASQAAAQGSSARRTTRAMMEGYE